MDGVDNAEVSYEEGRGVVTYDPEVISPQAMIDRLAEMAGYQASVTDGGPSE